MTTLTISNSGTAWIRDMKAQGKSASGGWAASPDAAYYASLDTDSPQAKPASTLTTRLADLVKLHAASAEDQDRNSADQTQRRVSEFVAAHDLPVHGNLVNVKA